MLGLLTAPIFLLFPSAIFWMSLQQLWKGTALPSGDCFRWATIAGLCAAISEWVFVPVFLSLTFRYTHDEGFLTVWATMLGGFFLMLSLLLGVIWWLSRRNEPRGK